MEAEGKPPQKQRIVAGATPEERDPERWPPEVFARIQDILDRSLAAAGEAARETFARPERHMTAREFVVFWNSCALKAMATASRRGRPHIAPVHAEFVGGELRSTIYVNAVRRRDLEENPYVALTTWGSDGAVAIVSGRAEFIPGSERETRPGASGKPRRTVALRIVIERIYAMKGRPPA
jgi:hypothetical protein